VYPVAMKIGKEVLGDDRMGSTFESYEQSVSGTSPSDDWLRSLFSRYHRSAPDGGRYTTHRRSSSGRRTDAVSREWLSDPWTSV